MKILIINGPNLNLLGEREPEIYGHDSLDDVNAWIKEQPQAATHRLYFYQSNHEGDLIDFMQGHRYSADGIIINPGGLTHYSVALRDAIVACQIATVEVHLSDVHAREDFRKISMITDVCIEQISGQGKLGYLQALELLTKQKDL